MKGELLMKRLLAFCFSTLLFLAACGAPPESSPAPANPYEALLCPASPSFGMSAKEVEDLLDSTIAGDEKEFDSLNGDSSYDGEYYGGFDEIALDNNCSICGVTYAFDNPMEQEFEDERTLRRISFAVRDKIPYNLRTEEKHGDIVAAYETVYDFLVEHYGTPVYTGDRVLGLQTIKWDIPEQNLGGELNLLGETDYREQGSFEVVYFSTDGYREDWYLR